MSESSGAAKVMLVEDDASLREATAQALELAGFTPTTFESARRASLHLNSGFEGCLVTDIRMDGMDGLELLRHVQELDAEIPVILITGHGDIPMAVGALQKGAFDFLAKPFSVDQLMASVRRALQARSLVLDNRALRRNLSRSTHELDGASHAIEQLRNAVGQVAAIDLDVLIEGETGTGKELVARSLHRQSVRSRQPFVPVVCSALGEGNGAGELIGLPGESGPTGLLRQAGRGVLFLDEIDALSPPLQARLLACIEARDQAKPAGRSSLMAGPRLVVASSNNLEQCVAAGQFRRDLFYRLSVLRVRVPPVRERREDILVLFAQFVQEALQKTGKRRFEMSATDRRRLLEYDWPGNVRELRNYAYGAVLNLPRSAATWSASATKLGLGQRLDQYEKLLMTDALIATQGNVSRASELLEVSRKSFYEKIAKYNLDPAGFRREKMR